MRTAFTMIELIFAIVIIAISVLSLPMMTQIIAKNEERGLVQEAIFAASTELNQIISLNWDTNATDPSTFLTRVIPTFQTDCNPSTRRRSGHINQPYHRRCVDNNFTNLLPSPVTNGSSSALNDINTTIHPIFINEGGSAKGYKDKYNSKFNVSYKNFDPSYTSYKSDKNIKRINVTITDSTTGNTITSLTTFSSNIGEIDYYKRSY